MPLSAVLPTAVNILSRSLFQRPYTTDTAGKVKAVVSHAFHKDSPVSNKAHRELFIQHRELIISEKPDEFGSHVRESSSPDDIVYRRVIKPAAMVSGELVSRVTRLDAERASNASTIAQLQEEQNRISLEIDKTLQELLKPFEQSKVSESEYIRQTIKQLVLYSGE